MKYYFSFDVESAGLFGKSFAVGWVIVDETGKEYEEGYLSFPYPLYLSNTSDRWVIDNVVPALPVFDNSFVKKDYHYYVIPSGNCRNDTTMMEEFWDSWEAAKKEYLGIVMITDCSFPVETNFLLACQKELGLTMEDSPYPILDAASVLFAHGKDPSANYERLPNELPIHNPVNDARQSIRIMLETMKENGR